MDINLKKHKNDLLFVALGGANEIGMNVNLYHLDGKWLMVDLGVGFASDVPGVDMLTADISFIKAHKKDLIGLIITHIHEDHLGAVQYLYQELEMPIYTSKLAANFLYSKLQEFNLEKRAKIHIVDESKDLNLDPFKIEFIGLTHSVPEMNALLIKTKKGNILHTGDWKFDPDPVVGNISEKEKIKNYGDRGEILAVVCDSTNALTVGHSRSEGELYESLKSLIVPCKGLVGVASFASNLARIHTIAQIAKDVGRKVVLAGYSLRRLHEVAKKSGYFKGDFDFISDHEIRSYKKSEILVIATGCQGEPLAASKKIATDTHPTIKFHKGDMMIFSSKIIPGNEKKIFALFDALAKKQIDVITEKDHFVHVSGHPSQDELKEMYQLARPKIAIPVHGEFVHTKAHGDLARSVGVPKIMQVENGLVIKLSQENFETESATIGFVKSGYFGVDGKQLLDLKGEVIKERRKLQTAGIVTISLALNNSLNLISKVKIIAVGCYDVKNDYHVKEMIEREIAILLRNKSKELKLSAGIKIPFLSRKSKKLPEGKISAEIEKSLRSKVVKIFGDLVGKRPAVEIFCHIIN
jgi:ribonuclease J